MLCQTVICKVNGTTLLRLNSNDNAVTSALTVTSDDKEDESSGEVANLEDFDEQNISNADNDHEDGHHETTKAICQSTGNVFEMETVDTSIESVRQYVQTTRKNGKVWHQCRWTDKRSSNESCSYGSKWSGAMVNHIRSHLGQCLLLMFDLLTILLLI